MQRRTVFLLVVLLLIALFTALNWTQINTPTTLSLGVTSMQAPLGLVMLGLIVLLTALFLVFVVYLQSSVLLDARRHAKELQTHRELADQAEASRFTELRKFLEAELQKLAGRQAEASTATSAKLEQLERDLRASVEQSGNTLAAYIGELEDRLERGGRALPPAV